MVLIALCLVAAASQEPPPTVVVDRDNIVIDQSCLIVVAAAPIIDADQNGVIHVTGDGIVVDFNRQRLRGAGEGIEPDAYTGTGVHVTGRDVTIRGLRVSGFKVGLHATGAAGLVIDGADVSDNSRQNLRSTPRAEDATDWLWPHANDANEWLANYGAGVYVEDSDDMTVRNVRARDVQNGIILDRVNDSKIYDNDCSFLSGWGLAMWRSSRNVVSRNAFDFCIRGYSHGVYNRGQDSAGILMFEQCSENLFVENSATHGGDGLFAFAGKEALGEVNPREDLEWYEGRGNSRNMIVANDLSYAAAHGLELTFSSGNYIAGNRLVGNAICGLWGGYSRDTRIHMNTIEDNGEAGYGEERGGINIEHGVSNEISQNQFARNACGIFLWWDQDKRLLELPWSRVNRVESADNKIWGNEFVDDQVAIQLRQSTNTHGWANRMTDVGNLLIVDPFSRRTLDLETSEAIMTRGIASGSTYGDTRPVGARPQLRGREKIVMTEWGPHDYESPRYVRVGVEPGADGRASIVYRYLPALLASGYQPPYLSYKVDAKAVKVEFIKRSDDEPRKKSMRFTALRPGVHPIEFSWGVTKDRMEDLSTVLVATDWSIRHFQSPSDPRDDAARWRAAGEATDPVTRPTLDERWAGGGPAGLEPNHFGTIATTMLECPRGRWRIRTTSDDGIRVWIDGDLVIDDWTWHPPTEHVHEFEIEESREVAIRVEHFELDGYAILSVEIEEAD